MVCLIYIKKTKENTANNIHPLNFKLIYILMCILYLYIFEKVQIKDFLSLLYIIPFKFYIINFL
jgi:hypothetical protein